ncbi:hypothetical protein EAF04_009134 [Stromatinia cepivora]|nr:hypothetical protein EAF04_009134 [Stromatinia cepivora]
MEELITKQHDTSNVTLPKGTGDDPGRIFTFFTKLPPELRVAIFELALAAATLVLPETIRLFPVDVEAGSQKACLGRPKRFHRSPNMKSELLTILAMLQVSQEFRNVAPKRFGILSGSLTRPIWLRPSVD